MLTPLCWGVLVEVLTMVVTRLGHPFVVTASVVLASEGAVLVVARVLVVGLIAGVLTTVLAAVVTVMPTSYHE